MRTMKCIILATIFSVTFFQSFGQTEKIKNDLEVGNNILVKHDLIVDSTAKVTNLVVDSTANLPDSTFIAGKSISLYIEESKINYHNLFNRPYINIDKLGAIGDGLTDNSTVIQNAIDSAILVNKPLFIPNGEYLTTGLVVNGELTIFGNGDKSILFTNTNSTLLEVTNNGFRMYDLQLKGTTGTSQVGVVVNTVKDYLISRVKFNTFGGIGINLFGTVISDSFAGSVNDCYFLDCRTGIQVENRHEYVNFSNNVINGSSSMGYLLYGGNFNINGGYVTQCIKGIYVVGGTNDSHGIIDGVMINHNTTALTTQDITLGLVVSDCQLHGTIIYLLRSKGLMFNGCEFGTVDFRLEGSESHFANSIMSAGNTINDDYNGDVSYTLWTGTIDIDDKYLPYKITGSTDTSSVFIVENKSGEDIITVSSDSINIMEDTYIQGKLQIDGILNIASESFYIAPSGDTTDVNTWKYSVQSDTLKISRYNGASWDELMILSTDE